MSLADSPAPHQPQDDRPLWPAIRRGWALRCPSCGDGAMLHRYLKVQDNCPQCGEALHHHRADDGPAYLTLTVTGKVAISLLVWLMFTYDPNPLLLFAFICAVVIGLSLYLLPRFKGMMVAIQWSHRMHGFGARDT